MSIDDSLTTIREEFKNKIERGDSLWINLHDPPRSIDPCDIVVFYEDHIRRLLEEQKVNLIGLFHSILTKVNDLYGKEIADMIMSQVNAKYRTITKLEKKGKRYIQKREVVHELFKILCYCDTYEQCTQAIGLLIKKLDPLSITSKIEYEKYR